LAAGVIRRSTRSDRLLMVSVIGHSFLKALARPRVVIVAWPGIGVRQLFVVVGGETPKEN
jgi:hypothetical protein